MTASAIVRNTSSALQDGLVTHMQREAVNVELAFRQHARYREALADAGYQIWSMQDAPDQPDAVFVEDTALIIGGTAIVTRSGAPERRAEAADTEKALTSLGFPTLHIVEPATLDGGDVLQVGSTIYVGRGGRTNAEGVRQLRAHAERLGRVVVPVRLGAVLHLKSAVTALPDGTVLAQHDLVEPGALPQSRPVPEAAGCHVVPLVDGSVLLSASAPRTAEMLTDLGFWPRIVDISEFEKREGCVTCLSILTDAAA